VVGIASLLVPDMKVAVPPVLADRELVLAHLRQLGSHRVPKTVPAQIRSQIHYTAPGPFHHELARTPKGWRLHFRRLEVYLGDPFEITKPAG
jgi:hypothetical protein